MATIKSALALDDHMSKVLRAITGSMNTMLTSFEGVQNAADRSFNPNGINQVRQGIGQANAMLNEMEDRYRKVAQQTEKGLQGQGAFNSKISEGTNLANKLMNKVKGLASAYLGMRGFNFVKDSLQLFDVQNKAEVQLKNVLNNMGAVEGSFARIKKRASELQKTTMFGDEALLGGAAEFATYVSDPKAIESLMGTLTNYAAGMSGGAEVGAEQMVQYATNLGKIMTGSFDAMTKKGFEFSEAEKQIIANGTDMQKAATIADVINQSWAGLAVTMANTPVGKIVQLKNLLGDAREDLARGIVPALMNMFDTLGTNFPQIRSMIIGISKPVNVIIGMFTVLTNGALGLYKVISKHWSMIAPAIGIVVAALGAYKTAQTLSTTVEWLSTAAKIANAIHTGAKTVMLQGEEVATEKATMAQLGLNAAMLKSPAFIIPAVILGVIVAVAALCSWIAKTTGVAQTGFGVFYGGIYVVGAAFKNFGLLVANIALGIWGAIGALCSNMMTAFRNAIGAIKGWFYGLLSTALNVIAGICEALNNLPFVEFDFSGISGKAAEYAGKAAEAAAAKGEYKDVGAAFSKGFGTFDAFSSGWASTAFANGAAKGDKLMGKFKDNFSFGSYDGVLGSALGNIAGNTGSIADNTGRAADALNKTNEELEWLRDVAEHEAVTRYTTVTINNDMNMTNQISNDMDLDGVVSALTEGFASSLSTAAEGIY